MLVIVLKQIKTVCFLNESGASLSLHKRDKPLQLDRAQNPQGLLEAGMYESKL